MVFKMLKGLGRLILTTTLLCGVGLFLCSNTVKADVSSKVTATTQSDGSIKFFYTNGNAVSDGSGNVDINKIKITAGANTGAGYEYEFTISPAVTVAEQKENKLVYTLSKEDVITKFYGGYSATEKKIGIDKAKVSWDTGEKEETLVGGDKPWSNPVVKVTAPTTITNSKYNTLLGTTMPASASLKIGDGTTWRDVSGTTGYAYQGEKYSVKTGDFADKAIYYECISPSSSLPNWYDKTGNVFMTSGSDFTGVIGAEDITLAIQYFPVITGVTITNEAEFAAVYLESNGKKADPVEIKYELNLPVKSQSGVNLETIKNNVNFPAEISDPNTTLKAKGASYSSNKAYVKLGTDAGEALMNSAVAGDVTITLKSAYGSELKTDQLVNAVASASKSMKVYALPTSLSPTAPSSRTSLDTEYTAHYLLSLLPAAADQRLTDNSQYEVTCEVTDSNTKKVLDTTNTKVSKRSDGKYELSVATTAYEGNANVTVTVKNATGKTPAFSVSQTYLFTVKHELDIEIDAAKTKSAINGSDKNCITVGDDWYLDLKSLITNNIKYPTGGDKPTKPTYAIDDVVITSVEYGSKEVDDEDSYIKFDEDKYRIYGKKPCKVTLDADVLLKVDTDNYDNIGTVEDIVVTVYPMPTAKYNSDRTITVTIPAKVSTGYGASGNIGTGRGVELVLENESKSSLTSTKLENLVSPSSSDYYKEYKISSTEVEKLITTASNEGKFSGDTKVVFKVIPRGYTPGSSSDIVSADGSKVYARTDSAQVYQIKSEGTNFTTSYAYGLDGQTVTLTAAPASGYTFNKWSDGVSSNPRSIKVSGTGTRTYTPESKETAASSKTGSGSASGELDDVPKTAESNSAIWLIVFMVFAVMGTAYALYLQLTAATSRHGK